MFNKEDDCIDNPKSEFCKEIVAKTLANSNLYRLEIPDDGNCFFYSIRAWILLNKYNGLAVNGTPLLKMKHGDIRKFVVAYGQANTVVLRPFYEFNNNSLTNSKKDEHIRDALGQLKKDKSWALGAGDYLPILAAEALQLNLHIYNWTWRSKEHGEYYEIPIIVNPDLPIATILRINNNHYDLLMPLESAKENVINKFNEIKKSIKTAGGRRLNRTRKTNRL
ncbi:MAG: hypothetical protein EBT86_08005 [Actinobacteria bacterium]|nr:hypothetical protein [Actinomycetota bacterium]